MTSTTDKIRYVFGMALDDVNFARDAVRAKRRADTGISAVKNRAAGYLVAAEAQAAREALAACWIESRGNPEMRQAVAKMLGMRDAKPFSHDSADQDQIATVVAHALAIFPVNGRTDGWPEMAPRDYIEHQLSVEA